MYDESTLGKVSGTSAHSTCGSEEQMMQSVQQQQQTCVPVGTKVKRTHNAFGQRIVPNKKQKHGRGARHNIDPLDPAAYSDAPIGGWGAGLQSNQGEGVSGSEHSANMCVYSSCCCAIVISNRPFPVDNWCVCIEQVRCSGAYCGRYWASQSPATAISFRSSAAGPKLLFFSVSNHVLAL